PHDEPGGRACNRKGHEDAKREDGAWTEAQRLERDGGDDQHGRDGADEARQAAKSQLHTPALAHLPDDVDEGWAGRSARFVTQHVASTRGNPPQPDGGSADPPDGGPWDPPLLLPAA